MRKPELITVYYDTERKKYFLKTRHGDRYLASVSELVSRYCFKMTDEIRDKAAEKHAKKRKMTKEAILEEWKRNYEDKTDYGNELHNDMAGTPNLTPVNKPTNKIIEYHYTQISDLPVGDYSEIRIFCPKFYVSIRIDRLIITTDGNGKRYARIIDYKTGALIMEKKNDSGMVYRMKPPIQMFPDSPGGKAAVQVQLYRQILLAHGFDNVRAELWHEASVPSETPSFMEYTNTEILNGRTFQVYTVEHNAKAMFFVLNEHKHEIWKKTISNTIRTQMF